MVLYHRSEFGGEIFLLGSIQFNEESIDSRFLQDTYSPVVSWITVLLIIVFAILNYWHMEPIDFVLAFPQAPIKTNIYMKPPKVLSGFSIPELPFVF